MPADHAGAAAAAAGRPKRLKRTGGDRSG
jgi:hypothetical protein